jgi:glycosyltransferase involved in cell wall biosynthesis
VVTGRRVLFVCSALIVGGAERQWSLLIPRLSPRFDISVLTLVGEGPFFDELREQGVAITCAHMRRRTDVGGWRNALDHAKLEPQLVVTQSINADVVGHVIARTARAAHLTNEHFNVGPGAPTRLHRELLGRLVAPRVDGVIAVSNAQVPRLLRRGYRRDTIRIIPNGVPTPVPKEPAQAVRNSLGIQPEDFFALLVATLRPEKDADVFTAAVRSAHAVDSRLRGVIAGGGPELERLRALAGADGVVQVLGERRDVPDLIDAANVACLSSNAEGVPMFLLEAMALGKPVVATNVGGVAEAVEHEGTGLLVAVGDEESFANALLRLAGDPALAAKLGEVGRTRHRDVFGVDRMVDDYASAFHQVLASRKSAEKRCEA